VNDVLADLRENERLMNGRAIEREDVIHGLQLSTICRKHVQMLGPPGTAKSYVARLAGSQFQGTEWFEKLLTKQTLEDTVVGYLDAKTYADTGQYVYNTAGTLTKAHFAFIDENYKANAGTLNALLSALNERVLTLGPQRFVLPLEVCWAASNETGDSDTLAAFADRMVMTFWVEEIQRSTNKLRFLKERAGALNGNAPTFPKLNPITLDELHAVQAAAQAIPVEETVFAILADLQKRLEGVSVYVSDRRLESCLAILQAEALWVGDEEVGPEHCEILRHALWSNPADRLNVAAAVGAIDKGQIGEIRAKIENALARFHELRASYDSSTDTWSSEPAKRAYAQECPTLCATMQATGNEIKGMFSGSVPQRVRRRAKVYLEELRQAFVTARNDAQYALQ
jgi:MoxR-like ATPase